MSKWRRSSFCANGDCIELDLDPETGRVAFRLSDLIVDGEVIHRRGFLVAPPEEFAPFIAGVKNGEFDDMLAGDQP
jgi:hypothetical protein